MLFALASAASAAGWFHAPWTEVGLVVKVPDGDTLSVRTYNRGIVTVRLAGVDTPERGQGYWRVARSHLLAETGTSKVTISCYKTDRYEREVCRVETPTGDLAASMLAAGLGWHYKDFAHEQSASERERYAELERAARELRLGLWKEANPMNPAICRKTRRSGGKCR